MEQGYIQVYTGNGKGKTTAAVGLGLRAVGAGLKVHMLQFVKGLPYSELKVIETIPNFTVEQCGRDCFISRDPDPADIAAARAGLDKAWDIVKNNRADVLMLDEVSIALFYKLFSVQEVLDLLAAKPRGMEIVLTGRYMPEEILNIADLVTEMGEVKHYYTQGVEAREGFEK